MHQTIKCTIKISNIPMRIMGMPNFRVRSMATGKVTMEMDRLNLDPTINNKIIIPKIIPIDIHKPIIRTGPIFMKEMLSLIIVMAVQVAKIWLEIIRPIFYSSFLSFISRNNCKNLKDNMKIMKTTTHHTNNISTWYHKWCLPTNQRKFQLRNSMKASNTSTQNRQILKRYRISNGNPIWTLFQIVKTTKKK